MPQSKGTFLGGMSNDSKALVLKWRFISFKGRPQLKNYVPGDETIDEYLVRQEKTALKAALATTEGNKTEAAKLLGMTFRSFRYKLTKYDID